MYNLPEHWVKKKGGSRNEEMKRKLSLIGILAVFLAGLAVMLYPVISNMWNQLRTDTLVSSYKDETDRLTQEKMDTIFDKARVYNRAHTRNTIIDAFSKTTPEGEEYRSLLDPLGNGIMGYIEIPHIDQRLVIYHGTGKKTLEKGCGHIAGTSLPVGGKSTHSVIAAHRGLPSAKLFTDLDQLEIGDKFYLFILDRTLAYEVDQIKVVEPECLDELQIVDGKDLVTLFTCTPYSVNTHRLLVRGHRVKYIPQENTTQTAAENILHSWILKLVIALLAVGIVYMTVRKTAGKKGRKKKGTEADL